MTANNLFIGYADITRKGSLSVSPSADSDYPETNVVLGSRRLFWKSGTSQANHVLTWTIASDAANFALIARANLLTEYDSTIGVLLERNDSGWTTVQDSTPILDSEMHGPRSEDWFVTFNSVSGTGWRFTVNNAAAGDITPSAGKMMIGTGFDMGRDPAWGRSVVRVRDYRGQREPYYVYELQWRGITNAIVESFFDEIGNYADVQTVLLYTTSYHHYLNDSQCVHCRITDINIDPTNHNNNVVNITFEEEI